MGTLKGRQQNHKVILLGPSARVPSHLVTPSGGIAHSSGMSSQRKCPYCHQVFSAAELESHKRREHGHPCSECSKRFPSMQALADHIEQVHIGNTNGRRVCPFCKALVAPRNMARHQKRCPKNGMER